MRSQQRYLLVVAVVFSLVVVYALLWNGTGSTSRDESQHSIFDTTTSEVMQRPKCDDIGEFQLGKRAHLGAGTTHLRELLSETPMSPRFNFSKCDMESCFDFSRCSRHDTLRVHIVPSQINRDSINSTGESNQIHENILKIIRSSKFYESDPEKACIFILEDDTLDRDPLSRSFRPDLGHLFDQKNKYGMNHLVFNLYSGSWPDYREDDFAGINIGAAILAKASNSVYNHRKGFDISLPLFSYQHPIEDQDMKFKDVFNQSTPQPPSDKTFFLTFKGKRYVFGSGSDTRNNLYHLNNQRDVIMLTTCRHGKKWRESSDRRCSVDELEYNQYDFIDLMKESTFCLTPRGRRLGSFRYLEAMSYGCIPVVLSDGWVKPFDEIINWSCAVVQYGEELLLLVPDMLRDFDNDTLSYMSKNCKILYEEYFSTMEKIILTTIAIIEKRVKDYFR